MRRFKGVNGVQFEVRGSKEYWFEYPVKEATLCIDQKSPFCTLSYSKGGIASVTDEPTNKWAENLVFNLDYF